jgi:hypothetical protein
MDWNSQDKKCIKTYGVAQYRLYWITPLRLQYLINPKHYTKWKRHFDLFIWQKIFMDKKTAERNIELQTWINFLSGVVFLIPVITLFYQYTGLSLVDIILIANVSTLTVWIFELPTSVFADTSGRKKSLVISVSCL